jgi:hypothetical protein
MTLIPSELSTKINACAGRHIPELVELWNYRKSALQKVCLTAVVAGAISGGARIQKLGIPISPVIVTSTKEKKYICVMH